MIFPESLSWSDDGNRLRLETRAMPNTWAAPFHAIVITIPAILAMTIINVTIIMTNLTIIMRIVIIMINIIFTTATHQLNTFDNQPQVWLSSLLYEQASPLMGKRHLRRVQNISVLLLEEVPRVAAGYDHNSIWPAGIVPLIPILIVKDPSDHGPSSSNQCLLVHLNNL